MKLAVTFFLFLVSHLSGGHDYAHAHSQSGNTRHARATNIETERVEGVNPNRDPVISTDDLRHENPYVISVEYVNEENIIRRLVSPSGYFLAFSYEIISSHPHVSPSDGLSFYRYLSCTGSCKYIEQRVLRI